MVKNVTIGAGTTHARAREGSRHKSVGNARLDADGSPTVVDGTGDIESMQDRGDVDKKHLVREKLAWAYPESKAILSLRFTWPERVRDGIDRTFARSQMQ